MSEIKAGDTVMVVHSCCGAQLGVVFTVVFCGIDNLTCDHCGLRQVGVAHAESDLPEGRLCHWPIAWLKKIPPLSEPVSTQEEATA
jgi:hypothetical protein